MLKTKNNLRKVWQIQKNVLTLHQETKTQCQGNNKKVEKMEIKNVELFNNILAFNNEVLYSQIRELEAKIKELKSENRSLKSDIDYLETHNKILKAKVDGLKCDILFYRRKADNSQRDK